MFLFHRVGWFRHTPHVSQDATLTTLITATAAWAIVQGLPDAAAAGGHSARTSSHQTQSLRALEPNDKHKENTLSRSVLGTHRRPQIVPRLRLSSQSAPLWVGPSHWRSLCFWPLVVDLVWISSGQDEWLCISYRFCGLISTWPGQQGANLANESHLEERVWSRCKNNRHPEPNWIIKHIQNHTMNEACN